MQQLILISFAKHNGQVCGLLFKITTIMRMEKLKGWSWDTYEIICNGKSYLNFDIVDHKLYVVNC